MATEMAVLMSRSEHANMWNSEAKIHHLGNFRCTCVNMEAMAPSCDTLWRLRPEFSLPVCVPGKQYRRIARLNSWMRFQAKRSPVHMLGSRMEDTYLLSQTFILPPARDTNTVLKCLNSDSLVSKQSSDDLIVRSEVSTTDAHMDTTIHNGSYFNGTFSVRDQPIEEPWLLQSSLLYHYAPHSSSSTCLEDEDKIQHRDITNSIETKSFEQSTLNVHHNYRIVNALSSNHKRYAPDERNQPVEEPWLLGFSLLSSDTKVVYNKECLKEEPSLPKVYEQLHQLREQLLTEDGSSAVYPYDEWNTIADQTKSSAVSQKDSVSRVILINSSVCTMQRIAVLEDGKLVEVFLEPVKNKIQCHSIYLGVVTAFAPQGGAFVNIGGRKPSLMEINHHTEPFIFPPFRRHPKLGEVNGSAFVMPEKIPNSSSGVEVEDEIDGVDIDDDDALHDECAEHEITDDYDNGEVHMENVNGSLRRHVEEEADVDCCSDLSDGNPNTEGAINKWALVQPGTKIIVQVTKEELGSKPPRLTAIPKLKSRFWVLSTRHNGIGVSRDISPAERIRLRSIAKALKPEGFGLIVRTVAADRSINELTKDLEGLLSTWKDIMEHAKSAALAADEDVEGEPYVMLHSAMGQTLSIVQDYFSKEVDSMVVDSPRTYHEVTTYLEEKAPDLCDRVELYSDRTPLFDKYDIEKEMDNMLRNRVNLPNGGYLVIEQTEALVSVDVNSGKRMTNMLGQGTSREEAILSVNRDAAKQIARELRLRDIGGIIVVDFITMEDHSNKRLVYDEIKEAVKRDRSTVNISELSVNGLMEITRKRVRSSVTFLISEPCSYCKGTGRVESLETSFSKIEREICRNLARMDGIAEPENAQSYPRFEVLVDHSMLNYLTLGNGKRLVNLGSALKVRIVLKIGTGLTRGQFKFARRFTRGEFKVMPATDEEYHNSQNECQGEFRVMPATDEEYHNSQTEITIPGLRRPNPPRRKEPPRRKFEPPRRKLTIKKLKNRRK